MKDHSLVFLLFLEVAKLSNSKSTLSSSLLLCKKGLTLEPPMGDGVATNGAGKYGVGPNGVILVGEEECRSTGATVGEVVVDDEMLDRECCCPGGETGAADTETAAAALDVIDV